MSIKIDNALILNNIDNGNTYFDILLYNCCKFEKQDETKIKKSIVNIRRIVFI